MMQTTHGAEWQQAHVETSSFHTNKEVDHLLKDVEVRNQYHIDFCLSNSFCNSKINASQFNIRNLKVKGGFPTLHKFELFV